MKKRDHFGTFVTILITTFGAAPFVGCGGPAEAPADSSASSQALAALVACGLDDGTIERGAHLGACDPQDTKKTTICHVPPGNPANAHTICVGNPAVSHHMKNHGDLVGACQTETMCPPPPPPGGGGAGGHGGQPDPICPEGQSVCGTAPNQCPEEVGSCVSGCCVPWI